MARGDISKALITYFRDHAGEIVVIQDLLKEMPEYSDRQVMQTMANFLREGRLTGLEKVSLGVWRYEPNDDPDSGREKMTLEVLKETDEHWLCIDADNNVYKVVPLG